MTNFIDKKTLSNLIVIVLGEMFAINFEKVCIMRMIKENFLINSRKVEITCTARNRHAIHRKDSLINYHVAIILGRCTAVSETRMTFDIEEKITNRRLLDSLG